MFRRITDSLWVVGSGGIVGALSTWAFDDRPAPALVLAAAALGAVLAIAVKDALGPKR